MHLLVTSSRMPYSVAEIRAFSRAGHIVHAADTFASAPGSNSRHATASHETVAPREDPSGYHRQIGMLADLHDIDLVVPTFEEVFYLMRHGAPVGRGRVPVFAPPFETLQLLHDKSSFVKLVSELGLEVAQTTVCRSRDELRDATRAHDRFFARAAYSRAGISVFTNAGPLAGETSIDDIVPTASNPWLVQPFLEGEDICNFSVIHDGRVVAHSAYRHPVTLDSAGGIVFESIEHAEGLRIAQAIAEATGYHGQMSLDLMQTHDGRVFLVECNPRPTAGVCVMPSEVFAAAVLAPRTLADTPYVAPAGHRCHIRSALIRDLFLNPTNALDDLREIFSGTADVYFDEEDPGPGVYQFLSLAHVFRHWRSDHGSADDKLAKSYLHDVCWDGETISTRPRDEAPASTPPRDPARDAPMTQR